jgi:hypothetical protein
VAGWNRRWVSLLLLLPAFSLIAACESLKTPPPTAEGSEGNFGFDLQVVSPRPGAPVRNSAGLVEVTGRVGRDWLLAADVVFAIDVSNSTLLASGVDIDRDGVVARTHRFAENGGGRGRSYRSWTTDADDAIVHAELAAARHLASGLDSPDSRVGVLTYNGRTRVRAQLGSARQALAAIDRIPIVEDWSGTDVSRALREAAEMIRSLPASDEPDRPRVVFLFSDGRPTVPNSRHWAARAALRQAAELADQRIGLCVLGFGEGIVSTEEEDREEKDITFLDELARTTGCTLIPIESPDAMRFDRIPRNSESHELTLRNLTTGEPGRAVRLLATGAFDGFVGLVPGANTIEVTALLPDGSRVATRRVVHYESPEVETDEERKETARLLLRLRERSRQLQDARSDETPPDGEPRGSAPSETTPAP